MMRQGWPLKCLRYDQICGNIGRLLHGICKYAGERIVANGPLVSLMSSLMTNPLTVVAKVFSNTLIVLLQKCVTLVNLVLNNWALSL